MSTTLWCSALERSTSSNNAVVIQPAARSQESGQIGDPVRALPELGDGERGAALDELAGAVMHSVSFNTIAHGRRLDPPMADMKAADVAPGGPFERTLPGQRVPSGAAASGASK